MVSCTRKAEELKEGGWAWQPKLSSFHKLPLVHCLSVGRAG